MDTKIYVMTHKRIAEIPNEIYVPMQVGKVGKEDFGYLGDDTGDSISDKNSSYCELTGMYWLWKHAKCDIIGICHYRRYFIKDEKLLDKAYIEKVIQKYPIILPSSSCVREASTYEQYEEIHNSGKDLDICREVIAEKCPEYLPAFDIVMQSILVSVGNMWITRKDIYDRYCEWLFDILFEAEKRIDTTGYDAYQQRVMGFLSERLFRVWLLMQPLKITEEKVKMIAPEDFGNADKKVELIYRCVKLKLNPVLQLYKNGQPQGTLATEVNCQDDFEGKIPVWVCWWQGLDEMPEIFKLCYESIKRNIPEDKMVLRLISLENCLQYVTFTESIIQKFNEGKISYTHLADCLRAELLYRYGGMWIDTTYYLTKAIPDLVRETKPIYTLRYSKPIWETDITAGRWSGNLWCAEKGNVLFQFLMECDWYYWETEDEVIDYYLIDYIIATAVEMIPGVKEMLECCPYCEGNTFVLQDMVNKKATPERLKQIREGAAFYKLNRQASYKKENLAGEQTIYGALCEEMGI